LDTHWKKKFKALGRVADRVARGFFVAALLVLTFGPLPLAPNGRTPTAEANNLEWSDFRPPLTDDADSEDADGFTHLYDFGEGTLHAIAVAPNGDIFAGGRAGDVDANNDDDCADAVDRDLDADDACDITEATTRPAVFRSTDGGKKWRGVELPVAAINGTVIRQIVVSPDYPSDDFVAVVFSDAAADADGDNGICWSTDAVLTAAGFACLTAATDAFTTFENTRMLTLALSPDFNWNDGNGEIAIGGAWEAGVTTAYIAQVNVLKAGASGDDFVATTDVADNYQAGDSTLHLSYTYDEEPIALARLFADDSEGTCGQILPGGGWADCAAGGEQIIATTATMGQVAFDDEYSSGGTFFAAVGDGAGGGGVFRFNGSTWAERTAGDAECSADTSSFAVGGNGSSTRIIASVQTAAGTNVVCRSTNEGSSWSDSEADGGDDVCGVCGIDPTVPAVALTRVAASRSAINTVYWTTSARLGGVAKSTSTGSSWADAGLTNLPYVVGGSDEITATSFFASASVPGGNDGATTALDALFYTGDYGTNSSYVRVLRTSRTDVNTIFPSDFATLQSAYIRFSTLTSGDKVLRSTNGGMTWDEVDKPDPFEDGPETNELLVASSARSATTIFIGGDKGHVAMTTDSGATWTILAKDFGEDIDEFDFKDNTTFFVTGEHTDATNKVWLTRDGGATFTQVGDAPWGSGDGAMTLDARNYSATTNTGWLLMSTSGATSTDDVYRMNVGTATTWTNLDIGVAWDSMQTTGASGVGDGVLMNLYDDAAPDENYVTFYPFTGDPDDFNPDNAADDEADNLLLVVPVPPVASGGIGTGQSLPGYTLQEIAGGRIMEMTLPSSYTGGVTTVSPVANGSVASNIGDNGIPAILRWNSVSGADAYEVSIGLQANLTDGTVITDPDSDAVVEVISANQLTVTNEMFPLIQGNTYYWAVRLSMAEAAALEGPWSNIASFSVSSTSTSVTSPQPSLPLDGAQLPGLSTQLSWNNPAGVSQVHVQVTPLNGDGPAINLILGSAATSYEVPAPVFGTGPYVVLPGASYTWRVRTTGSVTAVGETDSSWGPWSTPRTFTTSPPNAGTIQLLGPISGEAITDTTPTVQWKDANAAMFYYEVQVSADPNFGAQGAVASVFWNLIHGGQANPPNSWTVPDANALAKGTYSWRVRQRLQATPKGSLETGIAWSPSQSFTVK